MFISTPHDVPIKRGLTSRATSQCSVAPSYKTMAQDDHHHTPDVACLLVVASPSRPAAMVKLRCRLRLPAVDRDEATRRCAFRSTLHLMLLCQGPAIETVTHCYSHKIDHASVESLYSGAIGASYTAFAHCLWPGMTQSG